MAFLSEAEVEQALPEENRRIHKLIPEGVDVEYYANDSALRVLDAEVFLKERGL